MSKYMTIAEVVDSFSAGLPDYQRDANYTFVAGLHERLNEGGVWMSPNLGTIYKRVGLGFELVADALDYTELQGAPHVGK